MFVPQNVCHAGKSWNHSIAIQVKALWWPSRQHYVKYEPEFSFEAWKILEAWWIESSELWVLNPGRICFFLPLSRKGLRSSGHVATLILCKKRRGFVRKLAILKLWWSLRFYSVRISSFWYILIPTKFIRFGYADVHVHRMYTECTPLKRHRRKHLSGSRRTSACSAGSGVQWLLWKSRFFGPFGTQCLKLGDV